MVRSGKISVLKVGAFEIGLAEVSSGETRPREVTILEVGALKVRVFECTAREGAVAQVGLGEARFVAADVRILEFVLTVTSTVGVLPMPR